VVDLSVVVQQFILGEFVLEALANDPNGEVAEAAQEALEDWPED
jgi:hypothetical protein